MQFGYRDYRDNKIEKKYTLIKNMDLKKRT